MKPIRQVLFAALVTAALFSAIVYSNSCKKDACNNVICLNLGACDGGNCICPTGFEGARCEVLSRDKFIFTYNGGDTCSARGEHVYPIYLMADLTNPLQMTMRNFLNNIDDSAVCTIQAIDSFTFQGSNNSTTYRGAGKVRHDSLWMYYHVDQDTSSYDCGYFGQKRL